MISAEERQSLLKEFLASGRLSSARLLGSDELAWGKSRQIVAAVEGNIDIDGRRVTLRVGLCPRFPLALPQIFVALPDALGTIPHIERAGRICYRPDEGLLINHHSPGLVLEEALDAAIETLTKGLSGSNWLDFVDELEAYWRQLANDKDRIEAFVEPDDRLRRLDVGESPRRQPLFVADSLDSVQEFENQLLKPPTLRRALYIPLADSVFAERFNPRDFMSLEWTRSFALRHLTKENRRQLERLGTRTYPRSLVVLGIPRPKGGKGLVGLEYSAVSGGNPLHRGHSPAPPRYVALERRDRAVVLARVAGAADLSTKHVAVAGCGAVGGHVALQLARAGVAHLTLIDPERFGAENTFRHVLGRGAIRERKVYALKREIEGKVPYINVDVHDRHVEDVLQLPTMSRPQLDLLIYATGNPTVALYVNEQLQRLADAPALLFTWLEPYGIGGHALLTNTRDGNARGCFGCLFDSPIVGEPRRNRADFAAPGQFFAKDVSGCAAMYTPYADLDAVRTAELATRVALGFLGGRTVGHPLLSWKGDRDAFRAAGFQTSARYELDEKTLHERRFSYARENCVVCRRKP